MPRRWIYIAEGGAPPLHVTSVDNGELGLHTHHSLNLLLDIGKDD